MGTDRFAEAQQRVKTLSKTPDSTALLELYGLYKQATAGDVSGKRPSMLDIKGRAKYDAWEGRKGMTGPQAEEAYATLVDRLVKADGAG